MCINLKYTIRKQLLKLPGSFQHNRYRLCIAIEICDKTLLRWIAVEKGEKFSIPTDKFYMIADFFQCTPIELMNNEFEQASSKNICLQ